VLRQSEKNQASSLGCGKLRGVEEHVQYGCESDLQQTVGRSRRCWIAAYDLSVSQRETPTVISTSDIDAETEASLQAVRQGI
jgi:hypothetical protein